MILKDNLYSLKLIVLQLAVRGACVRTLNRRVRRRAAAASSGFIFNRQIAAEMIIFLTFAAAVKKLSAHKSFILEDRCSAVEICQFCGDCSVVRIALLLGY